MNEKTLPFYILFATRTRTINENKARMKNTKSEYIALVLQILKRLFTLIILI